MSSHVSDSMQQGFQSFGKVKFGITVKNSEKPHVSFLSFFPRKQDQFSISHGGSGNISCVKIVSHFVQLKAEHRLGLVQVVAVVVMVVMKIYMCGPLLELNADAMLEYTAV